MYIGRVNLSGGHRGVFITRGWGSSNVQCRRVLAQISKTEITSNYNRRAALAADMNNKWRQNELRNYTMWLSLTGYDCPQVWAILTWIGDSMHAIYKDGPDFVLTIHAWVARKRKEKCVSHLSKRCTFSPSTIRIPLKWREAFVGSRRSTVKRPRRVWCLADRIIISRSLTFTACLKPWRHPPGRCCFMASLPTYEATRTWRFVEGSNDE